MKPPMRFATTVDGGKVAFTAAGTGYPLVDIMGGPACNAALEWETPGFAGYYRELAARFRFVRIDPRGLGNSGPVPASRRYRDYILDDIDAVLTSLGIKRCAMAADGAYVQHLLEYAVTRPETVSHIVIMNPIVRPVLSGANWTDYFRIQGERAAWAGVDSATLAARTVLPNGDAAQVDAYARLLRSNSGSRFAATLGKALERNAELDLAPFLPMITQSTIILSEPVSMDAARELAATIAGAQLRQIVRNPKLSPSREEHESAAEAIASCIRSSNAQSEPPSPATAAGALLAKLTDREHEVVALVAAGYTNAEIGEALVISPGTVARHLANVYTKLGIHNRTQATAYYLGLAGEGPEHRTSA